MNSPNQPDRSDRPDQRDEQGQEQFIPAYIPIEPPSVPTPNGARMSVAETVYYEGANEDDARSCGKPFSRIIQSDDLPYQRKIKLDQNWIVLESGWVVECGMLHIENRGSVPILLGVRSLPTVEKDRDMHSPKIDPAQHAPTPIIKIRPGESCRFEPTMIGLLFMRAGVKDDTTKAECYLTAIPS